MVVGPGIRTGMPVRYENPREVGADRIVNAVAAFELLGGPVIAVDFGTATTFDCVSARGEYLGGAIFPGIHIAMEALFERASMLHRVEIARPKSVIGKTTTAALQSGLLYGYAGMVDSMVERIRGELGEDARVIATGGLARPRRQREPHHRAGRALPHPRWPAPDLREEPRGEQAPGRAQRGAAERRLGWRYVAESPPAKPRSAARATRPHPKGEAIVKDVKTADTHNFALVGHSGDGKTSLGEAILHAGRRHPGARQRGRGGTSVLNHLPEEKERRTTITSARVRLRPRRQALHAGRHARRLELPGRRPGRAQRARRRRARRLRRGRREGGHRPHAALLPRARHPRSSPS